MSSTAPISGAPVELPPAQTAPAAVPVGPQNSQAPSAQATSNADLRLVIEDDKASGSYVYVTVDPATRQVVSRIPRENLLTLGSDPSYTPGSFINSVG